MTAVFIAMRKCRRYVGCGSRQFADRQSLERIQRPFKNPSYSLACASGWYGGLVEEGAPEDARSSLKAELQRRLERALANCRSPGFTLLAGQVVHKPLNHWDKPSGGGLPRTDLRRRCSVASRRFPHKCGRMGY